MNKFFYIFTALILSISFISFVDAGVAPNCSSDNTISLCLKLNNDTANGESYWSSTKVYDYSNFHNNGTIEATPILNSTGSILGDGYLDFINNDKIWNFNNVMLPANKTKTISVFFKANLINSNQVLAGHLYEFNQLLIDSSSGRLRYSIYNNSGGVYRAYSATNSITTGRWYWAVATFNGTASKIYIDGVQSGSTLSVGGGSIYYPYQDTFRVAENVNNQNFNGSIDEVIVWNRTLEADEIWQIYHNYYGCITPYDQEPLGGNTTLCTGNYSINGSSTGGLKLNVAGMTLDLNSSNLYGNDSTSSTTYGIYSSNNNVTIKNGNLRNYRTAIKLGTGAANNFYNSIDNINFSYNYVGIIMDDARFNYSSLTNLNCFNATHSFIILNPYRSANLNFENISVYDINDTAYNIGLNIIGIDNLTAKNIFMNNSDYLSLSNVYNSNVINFTGNITDGLQTLNSINVNISNTSMYRSGLTLYNQSGGIVDNLNHYWSTGTRSVHFYAGTKNIFFINSILDKGDIGLDIMSNVTNITVINVTVKNMMTNFDGYSIPIRIWKESSNITILNSSLQGYDSCGILFRENSSGLYVNNTYFDPYSVSWMLNTSLNVNSLRNYYEPRGVGICAQITYKTWLDDGTQLITDNITKLQTYASRDIYAYNNNYSDNVQVFIRTQGTDNVNHDLTNYWYKEIQSPVELINKSTFYISNNYNNISSINGTVGQGYLISYFGQGYTYYLGGTWYYGNQPLQLFQFNKNSSDYIINLVGVFGNTTSLFNINSTNDIFDSNSSRIIGRNINGNATITTLPNHGVYVNNYNECYNIPQYACTMSSSSVWDTGNYSFNGSINSALVTNANNIIVDFNNSIISNNYSSNSRAIYLDNRNNVTFKNGVLTGFQESGIYLRRFGNITLDNIIYLNNSWYDINIVDYTGFSPSGLNVLNSAFSTNGNSTEGRIHRNTGSGIIDKFNATNDTFTAPLGQRYTGIYMVNCTNAYMKNNNYKIELTDYNYAFPTRFGSCINITYDGDNMTDGMNRNIIGSSDYVTIKNGKYFNNTGTEWFRFTNTNNILYLNSSFDYFDKAFWLFNFTNASVINCSFNRSVTSFDGYGIGFETGAGASDTSQGLIATGNNFTYMGTNCITVRNTNNFNITGNYCDTVPKSWYYMLYQWLDTHGWQVMLTTGTEVPTGFQISPILKKYFGDSLETYNKTEVQNRYSSNGNVSGNTYGPNINVFVRSMGTANLTTDFNSTNSYYRNFGVSVLFDWDEFFINSAFDNLTAYQGQYPIRNTTTTMLNQNFNEVATVNFSMNKTSSYFKNINSTTSWILTTKNLTNNWTFKDLTNNIYNYTPYITNRNQYNMTLTSNQEVQVQDYNCLVPFNDILLTSNEGTCPGSFNLTKVSLTNHSRFTINNGTNLTTDKLILLSNLERVIKNGGKLIII